MTTYNESLRRHFIFSGRVQGVGFRYKANRAAMRAGVTGWVKNLWDGTVEMEVQGSEAAIDRMIMDLQADRFIYIEGMTVENVSAVEHENGFVIR